MTNVLHFIVPGNPQGKATARSSPYSIRPYTPDKTRDYMNLIKMFAQRAVTRDWNLTDVFVVQINAYFEIPKSWPKWRQQAAAEGLIPHTSKPDGDNITKAVCDALNGVVWTDDSRVYHKEIVKLYTDKEPCVEVTVWYEPIFTREDWLKVKGEDK